MSSLWNATVAEVGENTITLHITAIHPDAGDPPQDAAFALRLLADGLERAAGATERASDLDARADAGTAEESVAAVSVGARRNLPFRERVEKERITAALRERGLDPTDGTAWENAFQTEWRALWEDPERLPQADLTIRLFDGDLLTGLEKGGSWDSAAYA